MKTRIVHSKIWLDDWFYYLSKEAKVLFLYCITNQYIGLTGYYEVSDRVISSETGLAIDEVGKAKDELEPKVIFFEGWVCVVNAERYNNYKGKMNEVAKAKEMQKIPESILNTLGKGKQYRVSNGYTYPIDTTRNKKSKIRNQNNNVDIHNTNIEENENFEQSSKINNLPTRYKKAFENPNKNISTAHQDRAFRASEALGINLSEAEKQGFKNAKGRFIKEFKTRAGKAESVYSKLIDSSTFESYDNLRKLNTFFKLVNENGN